MTDTPSVAISPDEIRRKCDDYTRESGIAVTTTAQALIIAIINSVVEDPHPTWEIGDRDAREGIASSYILRIPEILKFVSGRIQGRSTITTFDLLVSFDSICERFCFQ